MKKAYITCVNSDSYIVGVLSLNRSLKKYTNIPLYVVCTENIHNMYHIIFERESIYTIIESDISVDENILNMYAGSNIEHWKKTFFKFNIFKQVQFDYLVFLDADMMIVNSIDEAFDFENYSAVDDAVIMNNDNHGINSGFLVFKPSLDLFYKLQESIADTYNAKNKLIGDQDVLQFVLDDWLEKKGKHLSVEYNACGFYLDYYKIKNFKVLHFFGSNKPWSWNYGYTIIRLISYLLRGRIKTFKYCINYIKLINAIKKSYKLK